MLALATADDPDVLCVQEVPAWALGELGGWVGMREVRALAARPVLGPIPIPTAVGRVLTAANHGLLRSAFAGRAGAMARPRLGGAARLGEGAARVSRRSHRTSGSEDDGHDEHALHELSARPAPPGRGAPAGGGVRRRLRRAG